MPRTSQFQRSDAELLRKQTATAPQHIRHKARQKAIHNARHGRRITPNGGGQLPCSRPSGSGVQRSHKKTASQQTTPKTGSRLNPIQLDDARNPELESHYPPAVVMVPMPEALAIYRKMWEAGFPREPPTAKRFLLENSISHTSEPLSSGVSLPTIDKLRVDDPLSAHIEINSARDYVFDFGKHAGQRFPDVPEDYLRTIGGQLCKMESKHVGLREAFDYHRPGQGQSHPASQPHTQAQQSQSLQSAHKGPLGSQKKKGQSGRSSSHINNGKGKT